MFNLNWIGHEQRTHELEPFQLSIYGMCTYMLPAVGYCILYFPSRRLVRQSYPVVVVARYWIELWFVVRMFLVSQSPYPFEGHRSRVHQSPAVEMAMAS